MRVMCSDIHLRTVKVAALYGLEKRSRNNRADTADLGRDGGDLDLIGTERREWLEKRSSAPLQSQE